MKLYSSYCSPCCYCKEQQCMRTNSNISVWPNSMIDGHLGKDEETKKSEEGKERKNAACMAATDKFFALAVGSEEKGQASLVQQRFVSSTSLIYLKMVFVLEEVFCAMYSHFPPLATSSCLKPSSPSCLPSISTGFEAVRTKYILAGLSEVLVQP